MAVSQQQTFVSLQTRHHPSWYTKPESKIQGCKDGECKLRAAALFFIRYFEGYSNCGSLLTLDQRWNSYLWFQQPAMHGEREWDQEWCRLNNHHRSRPTMTQDAEHRLYLVRHLLTINHTKCPNRFIVFVQLTDLSRRSHQTFQPTYMAATKLWLKKKKASRYVCVHIDVHMPVTNPWASKV